MRENEIVNELLCRNRQIEDYDFTADIQGVTADDKHL